MSALNEVRELWRTVTGKPTTAEIERVLSRPLFDVDGRSFATPKLLIYQALAAKPPAEPVVRLGRPVVRRGPDGMRLAGSRR